MNGALRQQKSKQLVEGKAEDGYSPKETDDTDEFRDLLEQNPEFGMFFFTTIHASRSILKIPMWKF